MLVSGHDEDAQCGGVRGLPWAQLQVAHPFAGAFQKAGRVFESRSVEEPDIHMGPESVDVSERRVVHAGGRMSVVHKLANVRTAFAHLLEPRPSATTQRVIGLVKPGVDVGSASNGGRKAQKTHSSRRFAECCFNAELD